MSSSISNNIVESSKKPVREEQKQGHLKPLTQTPIPRPSLSPSPSPELSDLSRHTFVNQTNNTNNNNLSTSPMDDSDPTPSPTTDTTDTTDMDYTPATAYSTISTQGFGASIRKSAQTTSNNPSPSPTSSTTSKSSSSTTPTPMNYADRVRKSMTPSPSPTSSTTSKNSSSSSTTPTQMSAALTCKSMTPSPSPTSSTTSKNSSSNSTTPTQMSYAALACKRMTSSPSPTTSTTSKSSSSTTPTQMSFAALVRQSMTPSPGLITSTTSNNSSSTTPPSIVQTPEDYLTANKAPSPIPKTSEESKLQNNNQEPKPKRIRQELPADQLKFSQVSISCCTKNDITIIKLARDFIDNGWDKQQAPLKVVQMPDNTYTSLDNRRLMALKIASHVKKETVLATCYVFDWKEKSKSLIEEDNSFDTRCNGFNIFAKQKIDDTFASNISDKIHSQAYVISVVFNRMFPLDNTNMPKINAGCRNFGYKNYPMIFQIGADTSAERERHYNHCLKFQLYLRPNDMTGRLEISIKEFKNLEKEPDERSNGIN